MEIKYVNLNLLEGGIYSPGIKEFLQRENPDIFALQEVFLSEDQSLPERYRSLEWISSLFPDYEYEFAPEVLYNDGEKRFLCGNAIFSRFSILDSATIFYDLPFGEYHWQTPGTNEKHDYSQQPYNLLYTQIKAGRKTLNVFNTHGIWGVDGDDNPRRLQMGEIISKQVQGKDHVILGGDFNLLPTTRTIKKIEQHLTNVFGNSLETTFNMRKKPFPGSYANSVVDMVFVSNDIKVLQKHCPDVDISDHFPLACKFSY